LVDHIIPAHIEPERFFDEDAVQSLCDRHHAEKTARDLPIYGSPAAPRRS